MSELENGSTDLQVHVAHIHRDGSTRKLYTFEHHEFLFTKFLSAFELFKGDNATLLNDLNYPWRYHNAFREYFNLPQEEQENKGVEDEMEREI